MQFPEWNPASLIKWLMGFLAISVVADWHNSMIAGLTLLMCAGTDCMCMIFGAMREIEKSRRPHPDEVIDYRAIQEWNREG